MSTRLPIPDDHQERNRITAELYNTMAKSPIQMALFIGQLCEGLGQWLMIPTPIIEQIMNNEEAAIKRMVKRAEEDKDSILGKLSEMASKDTNQHLALLKAFYSVRPQIVEAMKAFGAQNTEQIPE